MEERNLDTVEKKVGDKKNVILWSLGLAGLGALIGDIFYGRADSISSAGHYDNGQFQGFYITHATGRDRGGIIEDFVGKDLFEDRYSFDSLYISHSSLSDPEWIPVKFKDWPVTEDGALYHGKGFVNEIVARSFFPDGAIIGGGGGVGGSLAADYISRKLKNKEAI